MDTQIENPSSSSIKTIPDDGFIKMVQLVQQAAQKLLNKASGVAFRTNLDPEVIKGAFLNGFSTAADRQHHKCSCCLGFLSKYGNLLVMENAAEGDYSVKSLLWSLDTSEMHPDFARAIHQMREVVENEPIAGPFYYRKTVLGVITKGGWEHFGFQLQFREGRDSVMTPGQCMADTREDFKLLRQGLHEFPVALYEKALGIFKNDEKLRLYPSFIAMLEWAIDLLTFDRVTLDRRILTNRYWYEAVTASKGRTHIAQGVMGEYLKTLGQDNAALAKSNFLSQTKPEVYLRPQAAPTTGNVQQAEKVIEALGAKESLRRRALRRGEVEVSFWRPKAVAEPTGEGVFGHLKTKDQVSTESAEKVNGGRISMASFLKRILPDAEKIELYVPSISGAFVGMTTAVDPTAPNMLKWNNLVSAYSYTKPSGAGNWGLKGNTYVEVCNITTFPHLWEKPVDELQSFVFILAEGYDQNHPPVAIFPDNLKAEYHGIRATIEAFSNSRKQEAVEEGLVGYAVGAGATSARVRVTSGNGKIVTVFDLDRFE